LLAED